MVLISTTIELLWPSLILLMHIEHIESLELLALEVPGWVPLGTRAALSCRWYLGPLDVLYSVKWYKDGKEFFRYVPRDAEKRRRFPLPGVDVDITSHARESDSSGSYIVLFPATLETSGRYRCEVSGEKPLFPTVSQHADMEVVALPEHGPVISGFRPKYHLGDRIQANCTSGHSQPATQLSWYISGEPLSIDQYTTSYRSENTLIVTSSMVDIEVTKVHIRNNVLKIKCLATITPMYWKSKEETAVLEMTSGHRRIEPVTHNQQTRRVDRSRTNFATTNLFNCYRTLQVLCVFALKFVNDNLYKW